MFSKWRRNRRIRKVKPGDGHRLRRFHWWEMAWRSMFWLQITDHDDDARPLRKYAVVVNYFAGESSYRADLYRDGLHHAHAELPAAFPVDGGVIEVAASWAGLKRVHYVPSSVPDAGDGGGRDQAKGQMLTPEPRSAEGLRARLGEKRPALSRWVGWAAVMVLVVALLLAIPQTVQVMTHMDVLSDYVTPWTSPVQLPAWTNAAVAVLAALAAFERVLTVRYHWLLDGEGFGDFDLG